MREAELEAAVLELCGVLGWSRAHFRPAMLPSGRWATHMAGDTGFPDLFLARAGEGVAAELKSGRGKPSAGQVEWLEILETIPGVTACLWRPKDWRSGEIEAGLRGNGPMPGRGAWRDAERHALEVAVVVRCGQKVRARVMG